MVGAVVKDGLSGEPIIYNSPSEFSIIGYLIGNTSQEIEIYENKEIVDDGKQIYYERRMETTKFGLAVQMTSVLDFESRILSHHTVLCFATHHEILSNHTIFLLR